MAKIPVKNPVVHFEVVGKDIEGLKSFYSEVAGWSYDEPPAQEGVPPYALVPREGNTNPDGVGIGGGVGSGPGSGMGVGCTSFTRVPADAPTGPAPSANGDEAGARLIALNMALSGAPREETARYLSEHFELADGGALLDDVYERAGR
jgi:hypothetical protein